MVKMEALKFFLKIWSWFIGVALALGFTVWATTLAGEYSFVLGLIVFVICVGGIFSGICVIGMKYS